MTPDHRPPRANSGIAAAISGETHMHMFTPHVIGWCPRKICSLPRGREKHPQKPTGRSEPEPERRRRTDASARRG
eukprot:scaffold4527_cov133-Isochrysis_galbana.AAC.4